MWPDSKHFTPKVFVTCINSLIQSSKLRKVTGPVVLPWCSPSRSPDFLSRIYKWVCITCFLYYLPGMNIHPVLLMLYEPDKLDMTHAHYPTRELSHSCPSIVLWRFYRSLACFFDVFSYVCEEGCSSPSLVEVWQFTRDIVWPFPRTIPFFHMSTSQYPFSGFNIDTLSKRNKEERDSFTTFHSLLHTHTHTKRYNNRHNNRHTSQTLYKRNVTISLSSIPLYMPHLWQKWQVTKQERILKVIHAITHIVILL